MVANDPALDVLLQVRQMPGPERSVLLEIAAEMGNCGDEPIDLDGDRSIVLVGPYAMRPCPRIAGNVTYTSDRDESKSVEMMPFSWGVLRLMPGMTARYEASFSAESRRRLHIAAIIFESAPGARAWADWLSILTGWDEKIGGWRPGKRVVMPADADRRVRRPPGNFGTKK